MGDSIFFYGQKNDWGEFSNFYPAPFILDGQRWPTSEHYFMSQKTHDKDDKEKIRRASHPREAKKMGRWVKLKSGWDGMKYGVMEKSVYAKFSQNKELKELLLSTGERPLHENCKNPWWGGGPNFPDGRDWLGKILIQVRTRLREEGSEKERTD